MNTCSTAEVFEPFMKEYIQKYQYKSLNTDEWKEYLYSYFSGKVCRHINDLFTLCESHRRFQVTRFSHQTNWITVNHWEICLWGRKYRHRKFSRLHCQNCLFTLSWAFCHTVFGQSRELVICDCSLPVGGVGIGWHRLESVVTCAWTTTEHTQVSHIHFFLLFHLKSATSV